MREKLIFDTKVIRLKPADFPIIFNFENNIFCDSNCKSVRLSRKRKTTVLELLNISPEFRQAQIGLRVI